MSPNNVSILLIDPKYEHNLGAVVRAAAVLGAGHVWWTGNRITFPMKRLPREERLDQYRQRVTFKPCPPGMSPQWAVEERGPTRGFTPVAVELRENAEMLPDFEHPENALYVFGPEDGTLGRGALEACHRFVRIPGLIRTPLNLAAAVNVVLYDRLAKSRAYEGGAHADRRESVPR